MDDEPLSIDELREQLLTAQVSLLEQIRAHYDAYMSAHTAVLKLAQRLARALTQDAENRLSSEVREAYLEEAIALRLYPSILQSAIDVYREQDGLNGRSSLEE